MTRYRLDGWQLLDGMTRYELERRMDRELERLTDDLRVCGQGYPSPSLETIREIAKELARRELVRP